MTRDEFNEIATLPEEVSTVSDTQVRLTEEELQEVKEANDGLIEVEEKSVKEGKLLKKLLENEDFTAFLDMYTTDEALRISEALTGTTALSSSNIEILQGMQLGIRYFKQFIIAKENESHGAELRLEARLSDRVKIEAGNVFKETNGEV